MDEVERELEVAESDLNWRVEQTYVNYMYKLDKEFFDLPEGGTLYLNLSRVTNMDLQYAYRSVTALQCTLGEGPLKKKHLILVQPSERVKRTIEIAVDENEEAFVYMDLGEDDQGQECNLLKIKGSVVDKTYMKVLKKIIGEDEKYSASELFSYFQSGNLQLYKDILDDLYGWGILCKIEERGKPGRPVAKFFAFWPTNSEFWPEPTKNLLWDIDGEKISRKLSEKSQNAA